MAVWRAQGFLPLFEVGMCSLVLNVFGVGFLTFCFKHKNKKNNLRIQLKSTDVFLKQTMFIIAC